MQKRNGTLKVMVVALVLCLYGATAAAAAQVSLSEVISMKPGEQQKREFYLFDVFALSTLAPAMNYLIVATGTADANAGTLTVKLEAKPKLDFGAYLTCSLTGVGFSLDEGVSFISGRATTPYAAQTVTDLNSSFGIALISALIQSYVGGLEWPVPMSITFSLSEGAVE